MCGIGTITLSKTARADLDLDTAAKVLTRVLMDRGEDATGILSVTAAGRVEVEKAVCDAITFNKYRRPLPEGTRALAVHTRFATQGPAAFNRNNHPVSSGAALVVHNGVIWEHETRTPGQPEVDTWVLAREAAKHAVREKGETAQDHGQRVALALVTEWEGSAAVGIAYRGQPFLITARLDSSPLYVGESHGVRVCASMRTAVIETFKALGLSLPVHKATRTETVRKAKKGRPAKTRTVSYWEEAINYVREGYVCTWEAGTHAAGGITVPTRYGSSRSYGSWHGYEPLASSTVATYGGIAARLLESGTADRCELCDTWHDGPLPVVWEMRVCDECAAAMRVSGAADDATDDSATDNGAAVTFSPEAITAARQLADDWAEEAAQGDDSTHVVYRLPAQGDAHA